MAAVESFDSKLENDTGTLADFIKSSVLKFPFLARTCLDATVSQTFDSNEFTNKDILFQSRSKYKFARIKVLPFHNSKEMEREYKLEGILKHDTYVGKEFLLPLNYRGRIKFALRPGSRGRYTDISQIIQDGQGLFRVEETTDAHVAEDPSQSITLEAKTVLAIKRRFFAAENPGCVLFECSDGTRNVAFKENSRTNCTVIEDKKIYNLIDLKRCKLFPRIIQFLEMVHLDDAALYDSEMNSVTLSVLNGPFEVCKIEEKEFVIGSVRDKEQKTMKTVLIPDNLWKFVCLKKRCFSDIHQQDIYIKKKFEPYCDIDFVEKSLYLVTTAPSEIIWLINPRLRKGNTANSANTLEVFKLPFEDSSGEDEEDDHIYHEIVVGIQPPDPKTVSTISYSDKEKESPHLLETFKTVAFKPFRRSRQLSLTTIDVPKKPAFHHSVSDSGRLPVSSLDRRTKGDTNESQRQSTAVWYIPPDVEAPISLDEDNTARSYDRLAIDGAGSGHKKAKRGPLVDILHTIQSKFQAKQTDNTQNTSKCEKEFRKVSNAMEENLYSGYPKNVEEFDEGGGIYDEIACSSDTGKILEGEGIENMCLIEQDTTTVKAQKTDSNYISMFRTDKQIANTCTKAKLLSPCEDKNTVANDKNAGTYLTLPLMSTKRSIQKTCQPSAENTNQYIGNTSYLRESDKIQDNKDYEIMSAIVLSGQTGKCLNTSYSAELETLSIKKISFKNSDGTISGGEGNQEGSHTHFPTDANESPGEEAIIENSQVYDKVLDIPDLNPKRRSTWSKTDREEKPKRFVNKIIKTFRTARQLSLPCTDVPPKVPPRTDMSSSVSDKKRCLIKRLSPFQHQPTEMWYLPSPNKVLSMDNESNANIIHNRLTRDGTEASHEEAEVSLLEDILQTLQLNSPELYKDNVLETTSECKKDIHLSQDIILPNTLEENLGSSFAETVDEIDNGIYDEMSLTSSLIGSPLLPKGHIKEERN